MTLLKDVMSRHFETVHPDATMKEALAQLENLNLSMLLVCWDRQVMGALLDSESRRQLAETGRDPREARVRECMTTDILSGREDQELKPLLSAMRSRKTPTIPVLDSENRLVGVFTLGGPWKRKSRQTPVT